MVFVYKIILAVIGDIFCHIDFRIGLLVFKSSFWSFLEIK